MLFNSYIFIFGFLPAVLLGFYALNWYGAQKTSKLFLVLASLIFYGWYTHWFVVVLIATLILTYSCVMVLMGTPKGTATHTAAFLVGIIGSLGNLAFWKYTNFGVEIVNEISGWHWSLFHIVLPLGISFYTFQQLTFIIDAYAGRVRHKVTGIDLALYVTFFPHLIVGPIVRYDELIPQIVAKKFGRFRLQNILIGLAIFSVGIAKKVIIADNLAVMVDPTFDHVAAGQTVSAVAAWRGALAYTCQLYFDFSGYSDMAIGLARMLGLRFPINFHSPLKARSILDFWRRWHITLTRMTTTYVFAPISMESTRYAARHKLKGLIGTLVMAAPACFITFLLIGLWHGANWTFLLFGLLHSILSIAEYVWRYFKLQLITAKLGPEGQHFLARSVTFVVVVLTLVIFRSPDLPTAFSYLGTMFGAGGVGSFFDIDLAYFNIALLVFALTCSQFAPNTQQMFSRYRPGIFSYGEQARDHPLNWRLTPMIALVLGFLFVIALAYIAKGHAVFLYFGF